MSRPFSPSRPEEEQVMLVLADDSLIIRKWYQYSFDSNFLEPSDAWSFTIADEVVSDDLRDALGLSGPTRKLGAQVDLAINTLVHASGYIDSVELVGDRSSGYMWTISGRDRLAQAVDSVADPNITFKQGQTLADVLKQLFGPFGWNGDEHFEIDNAANRDAKTGATRGTKTSKKGKPLKSFVIHQLKPHNHEGVFEFASRVSQRFGLWIWCSGDGEKLIVGKPDFDQDPLYQIRRNRSGTTNVLSGTVRFDMSDQPTLIIADGFGGGGEFGHSRLRARVSNPAFYTEDPDYQKPIAKYKDAKQILDFPPVTTPQRVPKNRTLFLHDDESKTQEQLDNFIRRQMSLLLRKSMTAEYVVEGHGQIVDGELVPWDIDTVVDVQDEIAGVSERMYVLGRTFVKTRGSGGTTSRLHLVRLNSIIF